MTTLIYGLVTGLGLIVAIGAQNVFVLRQGIARRHVFAVASTAALCDAALIVVGVAGVGSAVAASPFLARLAAVGGALFLTVYGFLSLRSALRGQVVRLEDIGSAVTSTRAAVGAVMAVSLLNPHVYLDTVVLLGGIGGQLAGADRLSFAVGAVAASVLWFFGLAYGARALAPLFRRPAATRVLDLLVAAVMFLIAAFLVREIV